MALSAARRALEPVIRRVFHLYWRFSRGLTLGVRAVVLDPTGRVFLVKHSYISGWHLRELLEEGNIELTASPALHGFYFNGGVSDRDHVAVFVVKTFRQIAPPKPGHEIIAHGFFATDALPDGTSAATRARIAEALLGAPARERW